MTEVLFFALLLSVMFSTRKTSVTGVIRWPFEMNWPPLLVRLMRELMAGTFPHLHNYTFLRFHTQVARYSPPSSPVVSLTISFATF